MTKTYAFAQADDPKKQVVIWCDRRLSNPNCFDVINGVWGFEMTGPTTAKVLETGATISPIQVWEGEVPPYSKRDGLSEISWIQEQVDKGAPGTGTSFIHVEHTVTLQVKTHWPVDRIKGVFLSDTASNTTRAEVISITEAD